jgi:N-acetylglutamate synthase/N-acetylornithine aminotransferase
MVMRARKIVGGDSVKAAAAGAETNWARALASACGAATSANEVDHDVREARRRRRYEG